jgi:hypothetical protein
MQVSMMKQVWVEIPDEIMINLWSKHGWKNLEDFVNRSHYYQDEILMEMYKEGLEVEFVEVGTFEEEMEEYIEYENVGLTVRIVEAQ